MKVFFEKVAEIEQHNARFEAGEESFSMAINQFSDMLKTEVSSKMNGFKHLTKLKLQALSLNWTPKLRPLSMRPLTGVLKALSLNWTPKLRPLSMRPLTG